MKLPASYLVTAKIPASYLETAKITASNSMAVKEMAVLN